MYQGRGKSGAGVQSAPSIFGSLYQSAEYEEKNWWFANKLKIILTFCTVNFEPFPRPWYNKRILSPVRGSSVEIAFNQFIDWKLKKISISLVNGIRIFWIN